MVAAARVTVAATRARFTGRGGGSRDGSGGGLEADGAVVSGGLEDEATVYLGAGGGDEAGLASLAALDEIAQLGGGDAAAEGLEPDDEAAAVAPARAAPAARAGDQGTGTAARAAEGGGRGERRGERSGGRLRR